MSSRLALLIAAVLGVAAALAFNYNVGRGSNKVECNEFDVEGAGIPEELNEGIKVFYKSLYEIEGDVNGWILRHSELDIVAIRVERPYIVIHWKRKIESK